MCLFTRCEKIFSSILMNGVLTGLGVWCFQNGGGIVKLKRDQIWAEMFEVAFDHRIVQYLTENHPGYQELLEKRSQLLEQYPILDMLWDQEGEIFLTGAEHKAFREYLEIKADLEALEREYHYFLGQADEREQGRLFDRLTGRSQMPDTEKRRRQLIGHLVCGRMNDADREFLEDEKYSLCRKKSFELEQALNQIQISGEARQAVDDYVSAVESEWLCYGELAYQYGMDDMLTILKQ